MTVDLCPGAAETWRGAPGQAECPGTSAGQLRWCLQQAISKLKREGNLPVGKIKATGDPRASKPYRRHGARVGFPCSQEQASDYLSPDRPPRSPFSGMGEIIPGRITRAQVHHASQREAGAERVLGLRGATG